MKLFCYGTLLNPRVQCQLWGHCKSGEIACVPDAYLIHGTEPRLARLAPKLYPGNPGLLGRILILTSEELRAAQDYEGPEYRLTEVTLESGETVQTFL